MISCEYVVDDLDEFRELEPWLFGLYYSKNFNISVYCRECHTTYFYKLENINGKLVLATDGESKYD